MDLAGSDGRCLGEPGGWRAAPPSGCCAPIRHRRSIRSREPSAQETIRLKSSRPARLAACRNLRTVGSPEPRPWKRPRPPRRELRHRSRRRDRELGCPAAALAKKQLGKPYQWGAAGPDKFDCSGLVMYVYDNLGVQLPRVSRPAGLRGGPCGPQGSAAGRPGVFQAQRFADRPRGHLCGAQQIRARAAQAHAGAHGKPEQFLLATAVQGGPPLGMKDTPLGLRRIPASPVKTGPGRGRCWCCRFPGGGLGAAAAQDNPGKSPRTAGASGARPTRRATPWARLPAACGGRCPRATTACRPVLTNRSRPGWETAVMVPYWIVGIPFRIVYFGLDQAVIGMDKLGLFGAGGRVSRPEGSRRGLPHARHLHRGSRRVHPRAERDPAAIFWARTTCCSSRGSALHPQGRRPVRRDAVPSGQGLGIQVGGGREEKNLTRYYGLGPDSILRRPVLLPSAHLLGRVRAGKGRGQKDRRWSCGPISRGSQAREPATTTDQSLGRVHADDMPYGYPGESNGWTWRLALFRDNADQRGRPGQGGFQSVGVSLFHRQRRQRAAVPDLPRQHREVLPPVAHRPHPGAAGVLQPHLQHRTGRRFPSPAW